MSATAASLRLVEFRQPPHRQSRHNAQRFGLSDREFQVIQMLAMAKKNKAIASELGVSCKTVTTYRSRAMRKLDLPDNEHLIHFAFARAMEGVRNVYSDEPNG